MPIQYKVNAPITVEQFIAVLQKTSLGPRRPLADKLALAAMLQHASLLVTAWDGDQLVGVARSLTDFQYVCYLSDLAVDEAYQRQGIGVQLQRLTQEQLGPNSKLLLLAAPAAKDYYQKIGYDHVDRCWMVDRDKTIG